MRAFKTTCGTLAMAMTVAMGGCEAFNSGPNTVEALMPNLSIYSQQQRILTGETTTVFAETANLLGRDVAINWSTTLGKIQPTSSGARAMFSSTQSGTAVITAEMIVDGRLFRETTNITVDALNIGHQLQQQQQVGPGQVQQGVRQDQQQQNNMQPQNQQQNVQEEERQAY